MGSSLQRISPNPNSRMSSPEEPRFVRFGDLPKSGRSKNHVSGGAPHAGVSVYPGRLVDPDLFRIDTSEFEWPKDVAGLIWAAASDRPAYFVWGDEVGRGPDNEPLLKPERVLPVPRTTDITSITTFAQPALRLWSRGPRNGSGVRLLRYRLRRGSEWTPDFEFLPELWQKRPETIGWLDERFIKTRKKTAKELKRDRKRRKRNRRS